MDETIGSTAVEARADDIDLSDDPVRISCDLIPGRVYRLRALVAGTSVTKDNAALVRFDVPSGSTDDANGLSMSTIIGPYRYLRSGHGLYRTDRIFTVAGPVSEFGVMAWANRGPVMLKSLTIETVAQDSRPTDFFLSFDVEALPYRAQTDHIDRLVWGRLNGGEYGIGRICDVLDQHGLKGNFLVDFASCSSEGDRSLGLITDFLASRGHEIHMHLHSEVLSAWGLRSVNGRNVYLDSTSYDLNRRLLDFTLSKYQQFVGNRPRLFRSGGYKTSPALVLAAQSMGIEAMSNIRSDMLRDLDFNGDPATDREPFLWDNGVLEIPVDLSSPEVKTFESFVAKYMGTMARKPIEPTFNVVMHSWSMTKRDEHGHQDAFDPERERRLHQICEHIKRYGKGLGYGEFMDARAMRRPVVSLARLEASVQQSVYNPQANATVTESNVAEGGRLLDTEEVQAFWDQRHAVETALRSGGDMGLTETENVIFYQIRLGLILQALAGDAPLPVSCTVADAGCGRGWFSRALAEAGFQVHGFDASPNAIETACRTGGGPTYELATLAGFRPLRHFDAVICIDVLIHVTDDTEWAASVRNLASIVRPGGLLAISDTMAHSRGASGTYIVQRPRSEYLELISDLGFGHKESVPYRFRSNSLGIHIYERAW
jgi:2-polyprenyl-3-methyl-5-hydroxy-6-metoxy-1,4-benzoquinol methylase